MFYRDVAHAGRVALQFWFWFTPIVYSTGILPDAARCLLWLNPMTALVDAYQRMCCAAHGRMWSHSSRLARDRPPLLVVSELRAVAMVRGGLADELRRPSTRDAYEPGR